MICAAPVWIRLHGVSDSLFRICIAQNRFRAANHVFSPRIPRLPRYSICAGHTACGIETFRAALNAWKPALFAQGIPLAVLKRFRQINPLHMLTFAQGIPLAVLKHRRIDTEQIQSWICAGHTACGIETLFVNKILHLFFHLRRAYRLRY